MRCAICNESIGNADAEKWGPEFAHKTCVIAFGHGKRDGQEVEREACALVCDAEANRVETLGDRVAPKGNLYLGGKSVSADRCARNIRARSNAERNGSRSESDCRAKLGDLEKRHG